MSRYLYRDLDQDFVGNFIPLAFLCLSALAPDRLGDPSVGVDPEQPPNTSFMRSSSLFPEKDETDPILKDAIG